MICEFRGGETQVKRVKKSHWLNGKLFIVENVEAEACPDCGERYYHASTLDALDRLLSAEHDVKSRMEVEVVSL